MLRCKEVLGLALLEELAGVHQQHLALAGFGLGAPQEEHDARRGGVVEEVVRQVEHAFHQVVLHEPAAHLALLAVAIVAAAAAGGAGIQHHGGAAGGLHAGVDVLHPAPVRTGLTGEARAGGETVQLVVGVIGLGEPVLVPHGVGHYAVEGLQAPPLAELGVFEGVADLEGGLHVVDDGVHVRHGPGVGGVLLAVEVKGSVLSGRDGGQAGGHSCPPGAFRRTGKSAFRQCGATFRHSPLHLDLAPDKETPAAAAGIVHFHAGLAFQHAGHDGAHLAGGVELARALPAALGELADEVLVALADDVGLHIVEAKALGADGLDEGAEAVVRQVALSVRGGVEVDAVQDAVQLGVGLGNVADAGGELLADAVAEGADHAPHGLRGVHGFQR